MGNKDKMKVAVYCRVGNKSQLSDVKKEAVKANLNEFLSKRPTAQIDGILTGCKK